jgi:hypothetical protein
VSIILKGSASWYSATDKGGNTNVAMMSARRCPGTESSDGVCERCGGDGYLINQMPFNPMGLEAAMPLSLIEKHGLRFGQLVKVDYKKYVSVGPTYYELKTIVVRLVDIGPSEKLCAEGRIIDLTEFAFSQLEDTSKGIIEVEITVL